MTLIGMENQLNYLKKSLNDTWDLLPTDDPIEDFDKDVLLSTIMTKAGTFEPLYTDPEYFYWSTGMWWRKWRRNFTKWAEVLQMEYNPIENYNRNEEAHDDTVDVGTMNQTTTNKEVMDDDTTKKYTLDGTRNTENDGTSKNTETIDDDATSETTTSDTENRSNNGGYTKSITVAGFNSAGLEPKNGETDTHHDNDEITKRGNIGVTTTDDRTTTNNGTTHNEGNETSKDTYDETGTDNRTTTHDGKTDQKTNNDRDFDHQSHIWGNIGVTTTQQMIEQELKLRRWNFYEQIADIFCDEMCVRVY